MIPSIPDDLSPPYALVAFAAGIVLLLKGSGWMVRGSVRLARLLGVSPFLIGLTIVAFGTSAPELAASIGATLKGQGDIAVGNVLGSNIANLCLILGLTAVVKPIRVEPGIGRVDVPVMVVCSLLAAFTMMDGLLAKQADGTPGPGEISRLDGLLLCAGLGVYVLFNARAGKLDPDEIEAELQGSVGAMSAEPPARAGMFVGNLGLIAVGLGALVVGAELLVGSAVALANAAGVPSMVIGLTLVAFGTSVPELFVSVQAARHDHPEIALGNVLGSNVFNLLSVLGVAALVDPIQVPPEALTRDLWIVLGISLLMVPIMRSLNRVTRAEGVALVALYTGYVGLAFA